MNISIEELTKIYKNGNRAINNINLEIESGMLGLLGPNGAGKTTLMRILATLMRPSSGNVKVNGLDLQKNRAEIRAMLGFLPQDFGYFAKLRTWEFLDYSAALGGLRNTAERKRAVEEMLHKVGLYKFRDRFAKKLSGGMKRRLGIAQALIGNPKIVIVDEPTTGLDPEERIRFRNLLSDMSREEIIIILSTHIVGDISSTCRKMALLNKGELKFQGQPDELINTAKGHVFRIKAFETDLDKIKEKYPVISTIPSENGWDVEVVADKIDDYPADIIEPNLEHAYIYFMEFVLAQHVEIAEEEII
ncbi:MAG: ABC transporter ATP-binding protein [Melioribacteraceae bacterium]|nr:ABC transporter ATP-binding protein [Melioribacteraceae bacterium]MCF8354465.1 ABC transporter ATP-binding protein [Melioribacteraceae bacterium]MCF8394075.1 ABC transporter ATP-binding protein [Melioribacteraceae bacterium]MCF8419872.1 ABC transporter ATP-binding protein [Melioribacteraceae bacterium]